MGSNLFTVFSLSIVFLLAKEIFPYESEKFTVLCILFFVLISYFTFRESIYQITLQKIIILKQEYAELTILYKKYLEELLSYKHSNEKINASLSSLMIWFKYNIIILYYKVYIKKLYFIIHSLKDQIISTYKIKFKIKQMLLLNLIKQSFINLKLYVNSIVEGEILKIEKLFYYFKKITKIKYIPIFLLISLNLINYQNYSINNLNYLISLNIKYSINKK